MKHAGAVGVCIGRPQTGPRGARQDALEALGEEDAACLQAELAAGGPGKVTGAEGQAFEVTPAMVDISRAQKRVSGRRASRAAPPPAA